MSYFLTGATGFIGRFLVERLMQRDGDVHVLVRSSSVSKLDALAAQWGPKAKDRIKPVIGDLSQERLGISETVRGDAATRRPTTRSSAACWRR